MEELKPCPFCGEKAYLYVNNGVKVICGTCKASTQALTDGWIGKAPTGNAVEFVIEAWNRRAANESQRLKELRKESIC